jgi:photosystem II stability/assembly factor-like uncharacterized protein
MKKNLILIPVILLIAASCNVSNLFFGGTGSQGVFKSEDLGDTFHESNKIDKKNSLANTSVNSLQFDPADTNILYLASSAGIFRSQDAGDTWKLFATNILVYDFAIDPKDSNVIYAAGAVDNHATLIKTADGGQSWKEKYVEPTTSTVISSVVVDPSNSLHVLVVLASGDLLETNDGGETWQAISKFTDTVASLRYGPNHSLYALSRNSGLFESKDNGKTFTNLAATLTGSVISSDLDFASVSQFLDVAFDRQQPGVLYLATDQGLIRSVNDGGSWSYLKMPIKNTQLRTSSVAVNPKDSNNLYAIVGRTMIKSINGGVTWQTKIMPIGQEVRSILIDPNSPNIMYLSLGARK